MLPCPVANPVAHGRVITILGTPNGSDRVFDFGGKRADLSTYAAKLAKTLDIGDWRLHDLRRTMASGLQRLGTKPEVIDRCLGHSAVGRGSPRSICGPNISRSARPRWSFGAGISPRSQAKGAGAVERGGLEIRSRSCRPISFRAEACFFSID